MKLSSCNYITINSVTVLKHDTPNVKTELSGFPLTIIALFVYVTLFLPALSDMFSYSLTGKGCCFKKNESRFCHSKKYSVAGRSIDIKSAERLRTKPFIQGIKASVYFFNVSTHL